MALQDILFWKYLELLLQLLIAFIWGWGVLFTLAKVGKYRNMLIGAIGCLGMFSISMGEILHQLPYAIFLWAEQVEVYDKNQMIYTFLSQPYRWEALQILLQVCVVAALAGRFRQPIEKAIERPVETIKGPVEAIERPVEAIKGLEAKIKKPIRKLPEAKAPEGRIEQGDEEVRAIREEETLYDYRVVKEFHEREPEEFTMAMLDKKGPSDILRDIQSKGSYLQVPEAEEQCEPDAATFAIPQTELEQPEAHDIELEQEEQPVQEEERLEQEEQERLEQEEEERLEQEPKDEEEPKSIEDGEVAGEYSTVKEEAEEIKQKEEEEEGYLEIEEQGEDEAVKQAFDKKPKLRFQKKPKVNLDIRAMIKKDVPEGEGEERSLLKRIVPEDKPKITPFPSRKRKPLDEDEGDEEEENGD